MLRTRDLINFRWRTGNCGTYADIRLCALPKGQFRLVDLAGTAKGEATSIEEATEILEALLHMGEVKAA